MARKATRVEDLPGSLDVSKHALLEGRAHHVWYRRGLFALVCVVPILALLDLFGQGETTSTAAGPAAELRMQVPDHVRGGLMYQARFDVTANTDIHHPQLVLGPGWWEQMTENSINPEPVASSTSNGRVTLSYGPLNQGQRLTVWIQFQVNPVQVGTREANVTLTDGPERLAQINRDVTVFP